MSTSLEPEPAGRWKKWLFGSIGLVVVVVVLLFAVVLDVYTMDGSSMSPTVENGDRLLVNRLASPKVPDVVVVEVGSNPQGTTRSLLKRVVAVAGDVITYTDCQLTRNGEPVLEEYLPSQARPGGSCGRGVGDLEIPDATVFVLGDNRAASQASRQSGPVPVDDVVGVVIKVD